MLFLEPGKSEPMRLQGAYISTEESEKIMERYRQWKVEREQRGMVEAPESNILERCRTARAGRAAGSGRPTRASVTRSSRRRPIACVQNQGGSTSLLQRKLGIGYGRAARIIDQLEEAGHPGPGRRQQAAGRADRDRSARRVLPVGRLASGGLRVTAAARTPTPSPARSPAAR